MGPLMSSLSCPSELCCDIYILHLGHLADAYNKSKVKETTLYLCRCSKDVRTKCQALTIARLTHSLNPTERVRIRDSPSPLPPPSPPSLPHLSFLCSPPPSLPLSLSPSLPPSFSASLPLSPVPLSLSPPLPLSLPSLSPPLPLSPSPSLPRTSAGVSVMSGRPLGVSLATPLTSVAAAAPPGCCVFCGGRGSRGWRCACV